MKTSHNLNNAMLYMLMVVFLFIVSLTFSLLLWALHSLRYYVFMLYVLQFKLYTPILCKSCFLTLYSYSLWIMLSSNAMNQSTWNFIILLCIIKSQLQHTFRYFKSIQNLSFMHHFVISLIFQHNWNYLKHSKPFIHEISSNAMNQSTWNFIILLFIIKSQLQHTFRYFKSIQNLSFMHHFVISLIFQHNWNYLKHSKHTC